MFEEFLKYIKQRMLVTPGSKILLAVSGGMDSAVMTDLFSRAGIRFGIAHCNFSLRGTESDADETFVRDISARLKVPFFTHRFDTRQYAKNHRVSLQMAARELRYSWFEEVRLEEGYDRIATAHHGDDQVETFFINLLRGTGIAGLHGIRPSQGSLIRPLLFATRHDIAGYQAERNLPYREDHTNRELKYLRNQIRHVLLPALEKIEPEYSHRINGTIGKLREAERIIRCRIDEIRDSLFIPREDNIVIPITGLKKYSGFPMIAWELFNSYGFSENTITDLMNSLEGAPGKQFCSPGYTLIRDRKMLILKQNDTPAVADEISITGDRSRIDTGYGRHIEVKLFDREDDFLIPATPEIACLDASKLAFPLILRRWRSGDYFYPLGLNRRKKISDLLTDLKFSRPEKEKITVVLSGPDIIWVTGLRIDHRFRITNRTRKICRFSLVMQDTL